jgi:hypothetical protein
MTATPKKYTRNEAHLMEKQKIRRKFIIQNRHPRGLQGLDSTCPSQQQQQQPQEEVSVYADAKLLLVQKT